MDICRTGRAFLAFRPERTLSYESTKQYFFRSEENAKTVADIGNVFQDEMPPDAKGQIAVFELEFVPNRVHVSKRDRRTTFAGQLAALGEQSKQNSSNTYRNKTSITGI